MRVTRKSWKLNFLELILSEGLAGGRNMAANRRRPRRVIRLKFHLVTVVLGLHFERAPCELLFSWVGGVVHRGSRLLSGGKQKNEMVKLLLDFLKLLDLLNSLLRGKGSMGVHACG
jgi:hypothetical protein